MKQVLQGDRQYAKDLSFKANFDLLYSGGCCDRVLFWHLFIRLYVY
jgi:hypothetical protein